VDCYNSMRTDLPIPVAPVAATLPAKKAHPSPTSVRDLPSLPLAPPTNKQTVESATVPPQIIRKEWFMGMEGVRAKPNPEIADRTWLQFNIVNCHLLEQYPLRRLIWLCDDICNTIPRHPSDTYDLPAKKPFRRHNDFLGFEGCPDKPSPEISDIDWVTFHCVNCEIQEQHPLQQLTRLCNTICNVVPRHPSDSHAPRPQPKHNHKPNQQLTAPLIAFSLQTLPQNFSHNPTMEQPIMQLTRSINISRNSYFFHAGRPPE
jgi:hypothetical protein